MSAARWEKVGKVGVDAGLCWVGDPCYIIHSDNDNTKELGASWPEFCDKLFGEDDSKRLDAVQVGNCTGVVVSTGYGDGLYNVYVRRTREGRIGAVKVVFCGRND